MSVEAARLAVPPILTVPSATGIPARLVLAGPGARGMAFVIDWLLSTAIAVVYFLVASLLLLGNLEGRFDRDEMTSWYLLGIMPAAAIYVLYHPILEPLMAGRTPGKRMAGLRVLTLEGQVPTIGALITRNVFRLVDSLPLSYVVGLLFVFFGRSHRRLGDLAAGTVVAVERAPFLEKLARQRQEPDSHAAWREARQRASALRRRQASVEDALRVVEDYRHAAREIGAARGQDEYLEAAYADLHDTIHRPARRAREVLVSLLRERIPAALHAMRLHVFAAAMLFVIAGVTGFCMVYAYPDLIELFASGSLIETVERGELWTEGLLNVTPSAVLSVDLLTNNIVVAFFAFCSGVVFGLGTFYILGMNGLSLGAIFALTAQHGLAGGLFDFVVAHGCVELSCICLAGAAGSYIGEALIRPGARTRAEAFRAAAAQSIHLMAAIVLLLIVCGFIEGYVSPDPEVPRWARVTIGVGYWLLMVSFLRGYVFGRRRSDALPPAQE